MKMIVYILVCSYLFARLDWAIVHYTRTVRPEWKDWMHTNERMYATVTRTAELIICAPAMFFKPLFYQALLDVEAGSEEQEMIVHAPKPDWRGMYILPVRDQDYVFVSWFAWFVYWVVPAIVWLIAIRRLL